MTVPAVPKLLLHLHQQLEKSLLLRLMMYLQFSAIEDADVVKVTVGALSFSVMVTVTDCEPLSLAPPPDTPEIDIPAVSSPS